MKSVILYSTGCPMCTLLKRNLDAKNIPYETCSDVDLMKSKGFTAVPMLEVDGSIMNANEALKWVREVGE